MKIYGICPECGYELIVENSNYSPLSGELEEITKKYLLQYHYKASPECNKF